MSQELLYTSAPRGLKPGSRGFCTVLSTQGMPAPLATAVEALSGYRPIYPSNDERAARNPVVYSHLKMQATGRTWNVLSRIADYGLDYSQRANKLAHHVILDNPSERLSGGPANLLSMPGFMREEWEGEPKVVALKPVTREPQGPSGVCRQWQEMTGDAGWAGVLAESFLRDPERLVILLFAPGQEVLPLFAEAISLLPPEKRWDVTFSTYFTGLTTGTTCIWRAMVHDSKEAHESLRFVSALRIDLTADSLAPATGGELVEAARSGERAAYQSRRVPPGNAPQKNALGGSQSSDEEFNGDESEHVEGGIKGLPQKPPQMATGRDAIPIAGTPPKKRSARRLADVIDEESRRPPNKWLWVTLFSILLSIIASLGIGVGIGRIKFGFWNGRAQKHKIDNAGIDRTQIKTTIKTMGSEDIPSIPEEKQSLVQEKNAVETASENPLSATPSSNNKTTSSNEEDKNTHTTSPMSTDKSGGETLGDENLNKAMARSDLPITFARLPMPDIPHLEGDTEYIHAYKWKGKAAPPAEKFQWLAQDWTRRQGDFRNIFGDTPHTNTLIVPRWLRMWKQRGPGPKENYNKSILYFYEPNTLEAKDAQPFAWLDIKSNSGSQFEYVLRCPMAKRETSTYLQWCGIEVRESGPDPKLLKRVYFRHPFDVPSDQRHFNKTQPTVIWRTGRPVDERRQPTLLIDDIAISLDGKTFTFRDEKKQIANKRIFPLLDITQFVETQLELAGCKVSDLRFEQLEVQGALEIRVSLDSFFGPKGLLADACEKLDAETRELANAGYEELNDKIKEPVLSIVGNHANHTISQKISSIITEFDDKRKQALVKKENDASDAENTRLNKLKERLDKLKQAIDALLIRYKRFDSLKAKCNDVKIIKVIIDYLLCDVDAKKEDEFIKCDFINFDDTKQSAEAKP